MFKQKNFLMILKVLVYKKYCSLQAFTLDPLDILVTDPISQALKAGAGSELFR